MDKSTQKILIIFLAVLIAFVLIELKSLIVPLIFAIFMAMFIQPVVNWSIRYKLPHWLILPTVSILTIVILIVIGDVLYSTVLEIQNKKDILLSQIEKKIEPIIVWFNESTSIVIQPDGFNALLNEVIKGDWFNEITRKTVGGLGTLATQFFLTIVYFLLLLAGINKVRTFLSYIGGDQKSSKKLYESYELIKGSITTYVWTKFILSSLVGLFYCLIIWLFGVDFYLFWGFLAFLFNFIPVFGPIISVIFPTALAFVQLEPASLTMVMGGILAVFHISVGNVVEPLVLGVRLKLNTVTVIFGLLFWAFIWGIPGMILAVPLLVLIKLVLEQLPSGAVIARIMSFTEANVESSGNTKK